MVNIEPNVADSGKYNVTEAAKALGIHRSTLLNYVAEGNIQCGISKRNKRKFFEGANIKKCWRLQY